MLLAVVHGGSFVESLEGLQVKSESQSTEARQYEVTASHNFQLLQQSWEDELKFNAPDLEAAKNSLGESPHVVGVVASARSLCRRPLSVCHYDSPCGVRDSYDTCNVRSTSAAGGVQRSSTSFVLCRTNAFRRVHLASLSWSTSRWHSQCAPHLCLSRSKTGQHPQCTLHLHLSIKTARAVSRGCEDQRTQTS